MKTTTSFIQACILLFTVFLNFQPCFAADAVFKITPMRSVYGLDSPIDLKIEISNNDDEALKFRMRCPEAMGLYFVSEEANRVPSPYRFGVGQVPYVTIMPGDTFTCFVALNRHLKVSKEGDLVVNYRVSLPYLVGDNKGVANERDLEQEGEFKIQVVKTAEMDSATRYWLEVIKSKKISDSNYAGALEVLQYSDAPQVMDALLDSWSRTPSHLQKEFVNAIAQYAGEVKTQELLAQIAAYDGGIAAGKSALRIMEDQEIDMPIDAINHSLLAEGTWRPYMMLEYLNRKKRVDPKHLDSLKSLLGHRNKQLAQLAKQAIAKTIDPD